MKKTFKSVLCVMLSVLLVMSGLTVVFAEEDSVTPTIVVSDIEYNPLVSEDGIVFNYADLTPTLYFDKPFTDSILSVFTKENFETYKSEDGEIDWLSLGMAVLGVANITNDALSIAAVAMEIYGNVSEKIDFTDLKNVDFNAVITLVKEYINSAKEKYQAFLDMIDAISLNADGTVKDDTIGAGFYDCSVADIDDELSEYRLSPVAIGIGENNGDENTYVFLYDWRLSPIDNAEKLNDFVATVKDDSGSEKVNIVSEGYGSTVAVTYLSEYEDSAKDDVKNFITVSSEFEGTSFVGDIYTGKLISATSENTITEKTSAINRYLNDLSDSPVTGFVVWLSNYVMSRTQVNQEIVTVIQHYIQNIFSTYIYDKGRDIIANAAGLWALVPADRFDDAVTYMYGDESQMDAGLYSKIESFNTIQKNASSILQIAKAEGINISVVAMWDIQIIPFGETSDVQSDGVVDTAFASFGADCIAINDVKNAMKHTQSEDTDHDHLSSTFDTESAVYSVAGLCGYIDASVCALPENTWFIQNMKNGSFDSSSNSFSFLMWLINADGERTVWDEGKYPQFIKMNRYYGTGGTLETYTSEGIYGKYLLGDINLDGKITVSDSILCDMIISGEMEYDEGSLSLKNADVNGDGLIDETDSDIIFNVSAGLEEDMTSGIMLDKPEKESELADAQGSFKATVEYNDLSDVAVVTLYIVNPAENTSANAVVSFNSESFKLTKVETEQFDDGKIVAGKPDYCNEGLTCSFKINGFDDDEIKLATYTFDLDGEIKDNLDIALYATDMIEDGERVNTQVNEDTISREFFRLKGDFDGNHKFNSADARKALRVSAKLDAYDDFYTASGDVDNNGKITASDARTLLRISAKLESITDYFGVAVDREFCIPEE